MIEFSESIKPYKWLCEGKDFEFINRLKLRWDELHETAGVFRYKIDKLLEKQQDRYLLQLNPDRSTKRRLPEQIESIVQPFNSDKFNFNKAFPKEILFYLKNDSDNSHLHAILINVSPISRYHSLLCPSINECLPQVITMDSLELTLEIMFVAHHRDLRIGFNSLCALASVNHLHYHIFLENNTLPVETEKCTHIKKSLYWLENYPVPAFCFELKTREQIPEISKEVFKVLEYLIKKSIAHNVFITRGQSAKYECKEEVIRILVWPRKSSSGVKQLSAFNVAVCELTGWFPIYNKEDYANLTTDDLENELRKWKIDNFTELIEEITLFI